MTDETFGKTRYALGPLFLIAVFFSQAAPLYWERVVIQQGTITEAHENRALYQYVYPSLAYGYGRLQAGELPLWNSRQLCGIPWLADSRNGFFQPLNAVFVLFPTERAMAIHAFLCLFLMGVFFSLFARSLRLGYVPAFIGAIAYAFCGAVMAGLSRPSVAAAMTWAPFVFWAVRTYCERPRIAALILAGMGMALLFLSGAFAVAIAVSVVAIAYGLTLVLSPSPVPRTVTRRHALLGLALMPVLALLLSAAQWIPTLAWTLDLDSSARVLWNADLAAQVPGKLREILAQFLVARPGALPHIGYMGAVAILLVPAAFFQRRQRREVAFFATAATAAFLLSLWGFRHPIALPFAFPALPFVLPGVLCLAVVVALGADRLLTPLPGHNAPQMRSPALFVLLGAIGIFPISSAAARGNILIFACLLGVCLVIRLRWVSRFCGILWGILLFIDLTQANVSSFRHPFLDAVDCLTRHEAALDAARQNAAGARIWVSAHELDFSLPANIGMVYPADVAGGWQLPLTRSQATWWRRVEETAEGGAAQAGVADNVSPLTNYMAACVFLASPDSPLHAGPHLREIQQVGDVRLFVKDDALSRAYWAPTWRLEKGISGAVAALSSPAFDAERECVVDADSPGLSQLEQLTDTNPPTPPGRSITRADATCSIEDTSAERAVVCVNAPQAGVTVLSDTLMPGWRATLDEKRCPILLVNGLFRGIATPAGSHEIVFTYRPPPFVLGLSLSLLALLSLAVIGVLLLIRSKILPTVLCGR